MKKRIISFILVLALCAGLLPMAADAGTYKVYYRSVGDSNHESTAEDAYITVEIAPAKPADVPAQKLGISTPERTPGGPRRGKFARIDTKRLQNAPRDDRIGVPRRISTSVVHRLRHPRRRGRTQAFQARQRRGRVADADLAVSPNQNAQGHGGGAAAGVFPYHRAERDPYLQD